MTRTLWLVLISACFISCSNGVADTGKINREELVKRHNVTLRTIDDLNALSVGNGRFCYTADITGMQTFPEYYANGIPLTTMSEWGWHSFPNTDGCKLSDTFIELDAQGRKVPYPINMNHKSTRYLRTNPHQTYNASWEQFWGSGGAVDLSESTDPRWKELERRVVLSQYVTAIQSRQQYPPQETGLTCDSYWYGKFHLEMHWWHSVHFALWGRLEYLENTLGYYFDIMPQAKAYTRTQGYEGVRWPKMTDPSGIDSPSWIGPLLVWQQPHTIYYAELVYRQKPTRETLEKYSVIVRNTAEFMASYPAYNDQRKCYELGPPIISYREFNDTGYASNKNPTFELAYWTWGLRKANEWRERMGLERIKKWDRIADRMAPWPVGNGIYVEQETPLVKESSSPAMLAAFGWLPESKQLNKNIMLKTLKYVVSEKWGYADMWGSEYNMVVWTAARLGEPEMAVDALLRDEPTNRYLPNGHNFQSRGLPVFLPGNAGLLTSVAMMCAGWTDCPKRNAPGFPDNGQWKVKWEGLKPIE